MKTAQNKLICIVGATASGKTGLGVALAKKFNGEIVSADSRQIYRGLDIGTGKDLGEYDNVAYHLIDICDPGENFTMFDWLAKAKVAIDDIWGRGKLPIVVGGTGLYVQALVEGFQIQETISKKQDTNTDQLSNPKFSREELGEKSKEELAEMLIDLDEEAFLTIDLNNPYRMVRAIEKAQSGEKLVKNDPGFDFLLIGKELPREELYSKIDKRVEEWFEEGFYEEVEKLLADGISLEWLNKVGLEYKMLANYIQYERLLLANQELEIEKLIENCKLKIENFSSFASIKQAMKYAIHQYARRQLIWWRRYEVEWLDNLPKMEKVVEEFVDKQNSKA